MGEPDCRDSTGIPTCLRAGPFTTGMAHDAGVDRYRLSALVTTDQLRHPMRGVYYDRRLVDDVALRVACLSLILPEQYVVTDRTAGWLWGVPMILAPGDHRTPPRVCAFGKAGTRMRNAIAASGERRLSSRDVVEVGGLAVTSPLRTACDLGRLLHRDRAIGALDALLRHGPFTADELRAETNRFRRYRGVVQLRALVPLVDARSQSPQESLLRLRWHDSGLPWPECQIEVPAPDGGSFFIDVGLPEERFGAEYDGVAFHGPSRAAHDKDRRAWITGPGEWLLVIARSADLRGQNESIHTRLREAWAESGSAFGVR